MFQISRKADYGILFLTILAQHNGEGPLSLSLISRTYRIPKRFLSKIAAGLAAIGVVRAHEGVNGGYELARDPNTITLESILRASGHNLSIVRCQSKTDPCAIRSFCPAERFWSEIQIQLYSVMEMYTLQDILDRGSHAVYAHST